MNRTPDVLTLLLLDPCLTADEAAREAAARRHLAVELRAARTAPKPPRRARHEPAPTDDGPAVGF